MQGKKFLHSIRLKNLLSYGSEGVELELEPLNVLIGPNASGKSNLIEAISLLAAAPRDLLKPIREGGGVEEWLWKGADARPTAELEASIDYPRHTKPLLYQLAFTSVAYRLYFVGEMLAFSNREPIYRFVEGDETPFLKPRASRVDSYEDVSGTPTAPDWRVSDRGQQSILARLRDSDRYPELTYAGTTFDRIVFFRGWDTRRGGVLRRSQHVDLPGDFLLEDASNLGLVINSLKNRPASKRLLLEKLKLLYEDLEDFETRVEGGAIQVFLHEKGDRTIPAIRLSDGTLLYLCLLAILCHPEPPPLICLEEPELGLHPDVIRSLAELLIDAAQRTQLIVTTHSDTLVSALSDVPEAIVVCERGDDGSSLRRLQPDKLKEWLERYQLGEIWSMGEIGGNRW